MALARVIIGARLRQLREAKKLSQSDIEKRTGLLCSYISRVENGHTVPSLETLEKFAAALNVTLYELFYEGGEPPLPVLSKRPSPEEMAEYEKELRFLEKVRQIVSRINKNDDDRNLGPPTGLSPAHGIGQVNFWLGARREGRKREKPDPRDKKRLTPQP